MFTTIYYSPFRYIFLRADDNALLELHFIDEAILNADPKSTNSNNATTNSLILGATFRWLDQYFAGTNSQIFSRLFALTSRHSIVASSKSLAKFHSAKP